MLMIFIGIRGQIAVSRQNGIGGSVNIDRMTLVSAGGQWLLTSSLVPTMFRGEYQLKSISGLDAMGLDRRRNPRAPPDLLMHS